jgi:hypothetical protein
MRGLAFAAVIAAFVAGCAYSQGSYNMLGEFEGERATVGCLDVAVASHYDSAATGPIASLTFGNYCDGPVVIDIHAIRATGHFEDGTTVLMVPFDPAAELRPKPLEARRAGREFIEYQAADAGLEPARLCLDVSQLDRDASPSAAVTICIDNQTPRAHVAERGEP